MFIRLAILVSVAMLAGAQPALAVGPRYASPTGTSADDCTTVATACDITTAIDGNGANQPVDGQEVIVEPGTYTLTATLQPAVNLDVHGVGGQPRPIIRGTGIMLLHPNAFNETFSYLEFDSSGPAGDDAINMLGGLLDRVLIRGDAGGNMCQCYDGTLRNSVVIQTGPVGGAWGVNSNGGSGTETLRNDTLIATQAAAYALAMTQNGSPIQPFNIDAKNVIALNTAGGHDVYSYGPMATVAIANSDFSNSLQANGGTITGGGGNISAAPAFVDQSGGDFRERASSPTVDAGTNDGANDGSLDYAGNPRQVGAATDIGAFEYQPPAAVSALQQTTQSATVGQPFAKAPQAKVTDAQGNAVPDVDVTFTAPGSGASGTFSGAAVAHATTGADGVATAPPFTAGTVAGTYQLSASASGVAGSAGIPLRNLPGAIASLRLTPKTATVAAASSERYAVEGFDAHGNDAGPATSARLSIAPDGACAALSCRALKPGAHTVTATLGSAHTTASLMITSLPPVLKLIKHSVKVNARTRSGRLPVVCQAPAGEVCVVSAKLTLRSGTRILSLGTIRGRPQAGTTGSITIKLAKSAIASLRHHRRTFKTTLHVSDLSGARSVSVRITCSL